MTATQPRPQILSVNVSQIREVPYKDGTARTGIFKAPVGGPVMVRKLNIDTDDQADRRVHGGLDMAVYAYPHEHYGFWQEELGRDAFPYGQFGENVTVRGVTEDDVRVGDIFQAGAVRFQVTQPRIPCYKLGIRMEAGDEFPGRFQKTGRMGWYFRVLDEGEIEAGTQLVRLESDENSVTIAEFIRTYLYDSHDPAALERLLNSRDLGQAWRKYLVDALERTRPIATTSGWQGYRAFEVAEKVAESESITSFHLKPKDGEELPTFLPGQYLTLKLQVEARAKPVTRTYSISSSPNRRDTYRISVKRVGAPPDQAVPPGLGSGFLHDQVEPGAELSVRAPRGKFFLDARSESPIVLLSAGVGLTPMVSMLSAVAESDSTRPVWFVHGARNAAEHALRDEVLALASGKPNIRVHFAYSRPGDKDVCDSHGRVSIELLKQILPAAAYDFYLCGPVPFLRGLYSGLERWGVPPARVFYEFFGPGENLGGKAPQPADDGAERQVNFAQSALELAWEPEFANLLDFAEAQGLRPAFSCRNGICHTCKVPLVSGDVEYICDPIDLPEAGQALICCAKPKSDVVIDV